MDEDWDNVMLSLAASELQIVGASKSGGGIGGRSGLSGHGPPPPPGGGDMKVGDWLVWYL